MVITDREKPSREAELRFYPNRKGGTDVWVRVNTYPAATSAATPPITPSPPKPTAASAAAAAELQAYAK